LKDSIQKLLYDALLLLQDEGILEDIPSQDTIEISRTRDSSHGDFSCNLAMKLAKPAGLKPRDLAGSLVQHLPSDPSIDNVEIAGPGFINFYLTPLATQSIITQILKQADAFGHSEIGKGQSVQVEFVSANPTGPLHVGHGRGAAYGAAVADLLEAVGFHVHREYYVNDAGRQMDILTTSVWLRYLELAGEELTFPANGYKGDYVWDIAATLHREHGDNYRFPTHAVFASIPDDEPAGGDKEKHIDALISRARSLLDDNRYRYVFELGLNSILDHIRHDLSSFGVDFDDWYSERTLTEKGAVNKTILRLQDAGHVYEKDGALWFRSTQFGDEKDRVIQRDNGQTTYFASDIAYHLDKLERGFDRVIDVWGADHHGYVPRVKAALRALGQDDKRLDVLLVQFANLYKDGQKMQMSTRSGEFVTLRELREEVGRDAARFFYVMRRHDQHLDFDLNLAKSQSSDNPVYYIQYAYARVASVLHQAKEQNLSQGKPQLDCLTESHETELISMLATFPERVEKAALSEEPHQIAHYLRDLANQFHTYYNAHQFLVDDKILRDTRLALCQATQQVIHNGLALLGVSAPERM
jgi:arginyl-tRNA synthetase